MIIQIFNCVLLILFINFCFLLLFTNCILKQTDTFIDISSFLFLYMLQTLKIMRSQSHLYLILRLNIMIFLYLWSVLKCDVTFFSILICISDHLFLVLLSIILFFRCNHFKYIGLSRWNANFTAVALKHFGS
jgi:hypothetical protein